VRDQVTYELRRGLVILLNSRHAKVPPGFKTRYASIRTAGTEVQLRIPNAIVYKSYVFDGISVIDCAFASRKDICGALNHVLG
jgi:hypothetical protein